MATAAEKAKETRQPKKKPAKFQLYQDKGKKWRWRVRSRNGRIIAASAQSFSSKRATIKAIKMVSATIVRAKFDEESA